MYFVCIVCCEEFHSRICLTHKNSQRISIHIQSLLGPTKYNKTSICHFNILHGFDSPQWPNKYNKYTQGQWTVFPNIGDWNIEKYFTCQNLNCIDLFSPNPRYFARWKEPLLCCGGEFLDPWWPRQSMNNPIIVLLSLLQSKILWQKVTQFSKSRK